MPQTAMLHTVDPMDELKGKIGPVEDIEIFNNQILVGVYMRPEKTAGGIILTDNNRGEDMYQSKVGLVLKMGASAFVDEEERWFKDVTIKVGDWIVFKPSDGWAVTINKQICRILDDTAVRGRVTHPDRVW